MTQDELGAQSGVSAEALMLGGLLLLRRASAPRQGGTRGSFTGIAAWSVPLS
jgi:hypothetical protein